MGPKMGFIPFLGIIMEWAQKWASSHSWVLLYYRGSTVGPKIGFVPNLLSRTFIMQGVKRKIIQVLLYIYIYIYEKFDHDWVWA